MGESFVPLSEVSKLEIVELLNMIFHDYVLKMHWSLENLERELKENDVSLSDSFVMFEDGRKIGIALLSVRRKRCRIAYMGILKAYRGTGLGFRMMDKIVNICKWHGAKEIVLEVPEMDRQAVRFYEKFGFRKNRRLVTFYKKLVRKVDDGKHEIKSSELNKVVELAYESLSRFKRRPNWHREPENLRWLEGYEVCKVKDNEGNEIGNCVWGCKDDVVYFMEILPGKDAGFDELLDILLDNFCKNYNYIMIPLVPEDDPLYESAMRKGFDTVAWHIEMVLKLH
ncbi:MULTISPECIES: N-acetyltransferase [unclassified Kosmotoga]|uniref:GNAT family N-acetyltransferase n=1 Tax=unclassified Kosmotoga TaxID=2631489 RepID=UPI0007C4B16E|nr:MULTISPECIES: GNAT family N-acetyltransferase [unclassified Kosmotoga]MDI3523772.1 hypothetical protein [Kosmotoga sp.]MDK2953316.1 hypothetical protein [Kosmotoga sp.]OAA19960.1 hypothetical protein DU53_09060 [Kosmotoga sp. DU53]